MSANSFLLARYTASVKPWEWGEREQGKEECESRENIKVHKRGV